MSERPSSSLFPATMWSAIFGVRAGDQGEALQALERLARAYWRPLYVYTRQRGQDHDQALDSVQGFFEFLISGEILHRVERRESRFRSFLLTAFQNWLTNQRARLAVRKRGGGAVHVALPGSDTIHAESALLLEDSPERSYDRRWARTIFDRAVARLDEEIAGKERAGFFQELRQRLLGPASSQPDWEEVAELHQMNANAVKQAAHALRQRLVLLLKQEVRAVVGSEADLADELRYLVQLLSEPDSAR